MAKKDKSVQVFAGIENYEKFTIAEIANGAIDALIAMREPVTLHSHSCTDTVLLYPNCEVLHFHRPNLLYIVPQKL